MAKNPGRSGAPSNKKKPRHTPAQKKEAAKARAARAAQVNRAERDERKKAARDEQRGEKRSFNRDNRENRDDRRSYDRDDRPRYNRDDRNNRRSYDRRDDRPSYNRDDRRSFNRDDRDGRRSFNRDDRDNRRSYDRRDDRRSFNRDDRNDRRSYDRRDDRPSYSRDDRRSFNRDDRDDRRSFNRDNRDDRRSYDRRDDRPSYNRDNRDDRRSFNRDDRDDRRSFNRDDRRSYDRRDDRRSFNREDRDDRRSFNRDDRDDRRSFNRDDRRSYDRRDDRPSYNRNDRDDRRSFNRDDRDYNRDDRPARAHQPQDQIVAPSQAERPAPGDAAAFGALGLDSRLIDVLGQAGITEPFPIQAAAIPDALAGRDVLGRGRTGSGKTLAFGLPLIHRLAQSGSTQPHRPRAVIMAPTRELAMQVIDALRPHLRAVGLNLQLVAGGMSYTPQLTALERGVDVLVATPGRLIDLMERGAADLSEVEVTVLDEADHMSQLGFLEAITQILDTTPEDSQRLLFSATLDHGIGDVADKYLTDPVTHSTDDATAAVTTMSHHVFLVHPHDKRAMTATVTNRPGRTVVFARTKLGADRIAEQLRDSGVFAAALHGGLNQAARSRVMEAFRRGELPVLVATDVAARGIHVDDVSLVLHVDPPADHKDYLHRSGRTARAGESGVVVTLALPHQRRKVTSLLSAAGVDIEPLQVKPHDQVVSAETGGSEAVGDPIPQSRLDELLSPRRRTGGPRRPGHFRGRDQGRRYGQGDRSGAGHPHRGRRGGEGGGRGGRRD